MKAVILKNPNQLEVVDDWPEPEPAPGEVKIRMRSVGLCGTDSAVVSGHRAVPELPWVIGHEGGGTVVAVGEGVDPSRVGQQVVIEPNYPCFKCPSCQLGHTSACPNREIVGVNIPGIMAEYVTTPARFAHPIHESVSNAVLACIEPLTVAHTAVRLADIPAGEDCLLIGAGSQGLLVVQLLVAAGVRPYVVEQNPDRLAHAESLGARAASEGPERFSHAIDAVGIPEVWEIMLPWLTAPASITVIGISDRSLPLSTNHLTRGRLTVRGSMIYDHPGDFQQAIDLVKHGDVLPELILSDPVPASRAADAFTDAAQAAGKMWLDFREWK